MPSYPDDDATWEEQANWFIHYYSTVCDPHILACALGLFLAQQWLRLLNQPQHTLSELELLNRVLTVEKEYQGSGWGDLTGRVRKWVAETKVRGEIESTARFSQADYQPKDREPQARSIAK